MPEPVKVTKVTVKLNNGKTGSGKTLRSAILNAAHSSKCKHCDKTQADAWEASQGLYCEGSTTGIHDFGMGASEPRRTSPPAERQ